MRVAGASRSRWFLAAGLLMFVARLIAGPAPASGPAPAPAPASANATHLAHGKFRDFAVYTPPGAPTSFALLVWGDEGWGPIADAMAQQLLQQGAMVVGIDLAKLKTVLEADGEQCEFPAGDLENLSHFVQAYT